LISLVADFARTGRLGPARLGMALAELTEAFGPHSDLQPGRDHLKGEPQLFWFGDIEVQVCHGTVLSITLPVWRTRVTLPPALSSDGVLPGQPALDEVTAALDASGVPWREAPEHLLDDDPNYRLIEADATGVHMLVEADPAPWHIYGVYQADFGSCPGPHHA
jgi:hypothetical protein